MPKTTCRTPSTSGSHRSIQAQFIGITEPCLPKSTHFATETRACPQLVWRLWNLAAGGSNPNRKENGSESDEERGSVMPVRRDWGFTNHRLSDSWEVGLRRADRWSALDYAMTNGIGSRICCPAVRAT